MLRTSVQLDWGMPSLLLVKQCIQLWLVFTLWVVFYHQTHYGWLVPPACGGWVPAADQQLGGGVPPNVWSKTPDAPAAKPEMLLVLLSVPAVPGWHQSCWGAHWPAPLLAPHSLASEGQPQGGHVFPLCIAYEIHCRIRFIPIQGSWSAEVIWVDQDRLEICISWCASI